MRFFLQSFSIWWITYDKSIFFRMRQFRQRTLLKMDQMIHTCFSCILSGCFDNISINIISLNICLDLIIYQIICLINGSIPVFTSHKVCPFFCRKGTIHTRCNIGCHHGCLDRKCAASAERIYQDPVFMPGSQHQKSCCQRLLDRCLADHGTISSLM